MGSFETEPLLRLPEDLQARRRELRVQEKLVKEQLRQVMAEIAERRRNCKHKAIPGGYFATYCSICGEMIDY